MERHAEVTMQSEEPPSARARARLSWLRPLGMRLLQRFLRLAPTERHRLYALTLVIGAVCGLTAVAFHSAIRLASSVLIDRAMAEPGHEWVAWALITPTLGALIAGFILHYVLPNARGSGIPQVKLVYAVKSGRLRLRDALGKFGVATLQLGTGSALGREGPTVQVCASVASALGRLFAISPNNLRRLIPVGTAAGIAAAFNAPIAAVTFTIEELVGDLDQTVLAGVVVAAALAAAVEHSVLGGHPVFSVPGNYQLEHPSSLLVYALLGCAAALVSRAFYSLLLSLRARFGRLEGVTRAAAPALGALLAGVLAVVVGLGVGAQGVLGDGYATLSAALVGNLSLQVMLVLALAKLLATVFCYSSGGAGGIFAPVLFIGGMLGGAFGYLDRALLDHSTTELGAFALVGMGALFAAVIRAPITSVLIIFEMTRGYGLILPLMIANTVAYMLARSWQHVPIYEALLEQDGLHLPQTQRAAAALSSFRVSDAMTTELVALPQTLSVASALQHIEASGYSIYPVVDGAQHLVGLVSESRLRRAFAEGRKDDPVQDLARSEEWLRSDLPLVDAVAKMSAMGARQLAVIDATSERLVGVLAMSDVMRAHSSAARGFHADESVLAVQRHAVSWRSRDTSVSIPHPAPRETPRPG
jgi:CIC family chloride channel protein